MSSGGEGRTIDGAPTRDRAAGASEATPALELRGISKSFGDVDAVKSLDLSFARGEVHALLGENGAGKTTLMNIAAGFLAPDAGEIIVDGLPVRFRAPRDALALGLGMVHQHVRLVEQFTVAENLALGAPDVGGIISSRALNERAQEFERRFGLDIDPGKRVMTLSAGEKQRVEILRTLTRGARVLILDEPTAVLTPQESDGLCTVLREMAAAGTTVVFISHKLNEVLAVADRVSVLRRGALVATLKREDCDVNALARLMFADDRAEARSVDTPPEAVTRGEVVMRAQDVSCQDEWGVASLRGVSIAVHAHEVVGVVGVAGNGQQQLEEVATGLRRPDQGTIEVAGARPRGVRGFLDAQVAHIPEDRLGMGLVGSQPIWRNAILRRYRRAPISRGPIINSREARRFANDLSHDVNLSTDDVATPVQHLSGGNAQKLLAGRELSGDRKAVVAVNPTQGLDLTAAAAVRGELVEARNRGLGILLISADLDEVLAHADRIMVLYEGRIVGEFAGERANRDEIGLLMGGGTSSAAAERS